ncbi:FG-GAP repeat domain-containing protein [Streptomyces sp. NPDC057854]|uniref:FG-GAP repeat domain-containing protein n=1 Tax=unclassified Streptomyces TaxID=2593676 RepID=UPI0036928D85
MRKTIALGGTAALLVAGLVSGGSASAADSWYPGFEIRDRVIQPGTWPAEVSPTGVSYDGPFSGTLVYAFSKAPLTDAAWTRGGLPAGMTLQADGCEARPGVTGVYTCAVTDENYYPYLGVEASAATADNTTLHYGFVYVPEGGDLAAAVKEAQTVDLYVEDHQRAARTVTVKTAEHVTQNTVQLSTPPVAPGTTVTHTAKVHAVDKGRLDIGFEPGEGMRHWEEGELQVGISSVRQDSGTTECDLTSGYLSPGGVSCEIDPGTEGPVDVTVTYTVKASPTAAAWRIGTYAIFEVYDSGVDNPEARSEFAVQSSRPVPTHHAMVSRDKGGLLYWHHGTGKASAPFREWSETVGRGWGVYNAVTKLAPITTEAAGGGVVARDTSGVLWSYRTTGSSYEPLTARVRVGGGWGIYNQLTGVGDVSGDGRPDMIARDTSGVLWLYKGTTSTTAPFATRVRIGGGWGIYNQFTGAGDLNGDGRADLIARDTSGVLWLYPATGKADVPYGTRVRVGSGWQGYSLVSSPGDLTDDGRADLVARDGSGNVYLYKGTGSGTAPYAARVKISLGEGPAVTSLNALL